MTVQPVAPTRLCGTCTWYDKDGHETGWGKCRRYPPQPDLTMAEPRGRWPLVAATDYCGEYAKAGS